MKREWQLIFHSIISQLDDLFLMIACEAGFKEP